MESGLVYVVHNDWIQNPNAKEGCKTYKIGITAGSVEDRYYGLGLKMPSEFKCDFAYRFNSEQYKKVETTLHNLLNQTNVGGEWFDLNRIALNGVHEVCKQNGGELITDAIEDEIEGEKKQDRESTKVLSGTRSLKKEFWAYFIEYLEQHGTFLRYCKSRCIANKDWFWIGTGRAGCPIVVWMDTSDSQIGCCLCIQSKWIKGNEVSAKKAYFKLKEEQEIIHKEIGEKLVWHRYCDDDDDHDSEDSEIGVTREGNLNERERWEEYSKWFKKYAELLHKTFSDRVKNLEL